MQEDGARRPRVSLYAMPPFRNERQRLEQEQAELPGQIIAHRSELAVTPASNTAQRERLEWQLRRVQKRLGEVRARLATMPSKASSE